jgi:outer membrane protein assembly factor BamB
MRLNAVLTLLASLVLVACSSGPLREAPVPLPEERPEKARLTIDWWHILVDFYTEVPFNRIAPTVTEQGILTASPLGEVVLLNEQGRFVWRRQVADQIVAPIAADERNMVVVTGNGDVQMLDWEGGQVWQVAISALATEAPVLLDDRIIVQTTDGRVSALERNTGRPLWEYLDVEPNLTVTGTAAPVVVNNWVVTGLANGKLVALNLDDGSPEWEYRLARASGKTDVSRLVDVDGSVSVIDGFIVAAGYQGDMLVIEADSGRVVASKPFSTYRSIVPGENYWYGVDDQSHVTAFDPQTLEPVWVQDQFTYRRLTKVVEWPGKDVLAVADHAGFVHVLDANSGEWLVSHQIDWTGIYSAPVPFGDRLLQQGDSSRIKMLSLRRRDQ